MLRRPQPHPSGDADIPEKPAPPCSCDQDPVEGLKKLFVDYAQGVALARGRDPATRPVFLRLHGVAHGAFVVRPPRRPPRPRGRAERDRRVRPPG